MFGRRWIYTHACGSWKVLFHMFAFAFLPAASESRAGLVPKQAWTEVVGHGAQSQGQGESKKQLPGEAVFWM